jgi:general secretion pathway protein A
MYLDYFGLKRLPFSIAPDPELLYLSPAHHEALAHLNYALTGHGGLICLTGEVGMGKTTLCRAFIEQAPEHVDIAYIFNPMLSAPELLQAICNELEIPCEPAANGRDLTNKQLIDLLYAALIDRYSNGRKVICIIDEAQCMPAPLLEQIRLLTNLETSRDKLLTLILVGQPELQDTLGQHNIRQLDQRITARFHIPAMTQQQLGPYLQHRLERAGCQQPLFDRSAILAIWQGSKGIPRLINCIADRALLGAYATGQKVVNKAIAKQASSEVVATRKPVRVQMSPFDKMKSISVLMLSVVIMVAALGITSNYSDFSLIRYLKGPNQYQQLANAYGLDAQYQYDTCLNIQQLTDMECLSLDWPLSDLKRLQRPIAVYDGVQWQIRQASALQIKPQQSFILWQSISDFNKPIRPGDSHALIVWLRSHLAVDDEQSEWQVISPTGSGSSGFDRYYDPILANKVGSFQQQVGLKSDRIIGLKTLLVLQDRVSSDSAEVL